LDLDNFKDINDSLGHRVGDRLLEAVGVRLTNAVREEDSVGRLGGDEFVILLEDSLLAGGAEAVTARVLEALEVPFEVDGSETPITITASIGIVEGVAATPEEMLQQADIALYEAKTSGNSSSVAFFSPSMQDAVHQHRRLEADLLFAQEAGEFFLLYQPTYDLTSGSLHGVEALLRWRHPIRGVVQPDDFIPALESNGLIVPVGRWVIEEACRQGAEWMRQGHRMTVAINVSANQFTRDGIVDDVRRALAESGLDPALCVLELTETILMDNATETLQLLDQLKALGVRLAIDDFGTGYSSLTYLSQFPIDILKIDRTFVTDIADDAEAASLVHHIVELARALQLETVAEGIENSVQRDQLIAERVDIGQGYLYGRPLEVAVVNQLLSKLKV